MPWLDPAHRVFKLAAIALAAVAVFALGAAAKSDDAASPFSHTYAQMRAAGAGLAPVARAAAQMARSGDLETEVLIDLMDRTETFSHVALVASKRLRDGGPDDLACIYLGLSEDADARGRALAQAGLDVDPAELDALAALFEDAVLVTPDTQTEEAGPEGPASFTCEATKTALAAPQL